MRYGRLWISALCLTLAACAGRSSSSVPVPADASSLHRTIVPQVVQTGKKPVQWTQFPWGDTNAPHQFDGVVTGRDKNIWYSDYNGQSLIKMQMSGATTKFPLTYGSGTNFYPSSITVGADGKFYLASANATGILGVATTSGSFSTKVIPSGDYGYDGQLTLGPDGNVWFTELAHIANITPSGTVTEYTYPDGETSNFYGAITVGSNGDLWATEYNVAVIDDIDPTSGTITQYPLPCGGNGLISAKDGNLWVSCSNQLVRVTTSGSYTTIYNPYSDNTYPNSFALGPDGNPWFTVASYNQIAEYDIAKNALFAYNPPSTNTTDYGLTAGPDGNIWALDSNGKTDVYIVKVLGVAPASVSFHVGNTRTLTVTETGTTAWTATSSSPGVASVAQGGSANTFTLTAHGLGTTNVTIKDAIGNSFVVKVKVT